MRKLDFADLKNIYEYEKVRDGYRARIIELKKHRRVSVGPKMSFVFENRDTIAFQIQEMMRVERIVKDESVAEELEVYNQLLPDAGELGATLFIEIEDQAVIRQELLGMLGLDESNVVTLVISGEHVVPVQFETGRSKEDKISAVHYVRFAFSAEALAAFCMPEANVEIVVSHPNYRHRAALDESTRRSLAQDFPSK